MPDTIERWARKELTNDDGYLLKSYKAQYSYWEFAVVLRKLLVLLVAASFAARTERTPDPGHGVRFGRAAAMPPV